MLHRNSIAAALIALAVGACKGDATPDPPPTPDAATLAKLDQVARALSEVDWALSGVAAAAGARHSAVYGPEITAALDAVASASPDRRSMAVAKALSPLITELGCVATLDQVSVMPAWERGPHLAASCPPSGPRAVDADQVRHVDAITVLLAVAMELDARKRGFAGHGAHRAILKAILHPEAAADLVIRLDSGGVSVGTTKAADLVCERRGAPCVDRFEDLPGTAAATRLVGKLDGLTAAARKAASPDPDASTSAVVKSSRWVPYGAVAAVLESLSAGGLYQGWLGPESTGAADPEVREVGWVAGAPAPTEHSWVVVRLSTTGLTVRSFDGVDETLAKTQDYRGAAVQDVTRLNDQLKHVGGGPERVMHLGADPTVPTADVLDIIMAWRERNPRAQLTLYTAYTAR